MQEQYPTIDAAYKYFTQSKIKHKKELKQKAEEKKKNTERKDKGKNTILAANVE